MEPTISARVAALGHRLPRPHQPDTPFLLYRRAGALLFVSGQVPQFEGERRHVGKVGAGIMIEEAEAAARLCALNILAWLAHAVDDEAGRVAGCVRLGGFVNCTPDFADQSRVINAASRLIVEVFGESGRHARAAVGVAALPFGCAVEIDAIFEVAA